MNKITALLLLLFSFSTINAQEIIPFRMTKYNNLIVKTQVNNKDSLDLMFQIAMEEASVSPERKRSANHIIFKDGISDGNTITTGKNTYRDVRLFDNELTGHEADGKIGTGIFKGRIFKIDYDNHRFLVYETMPDLKGYQTVTLVYRNGQLFIQAENVIDGKTITGDFLLQSGYSGGIIYSNAFADGKDLDQKLKSLVKKH